MRLSDLAPGLVLGDGVQLGEGVRIGAHVVIHPGTVVGDGCEIQDGAVLGKPPKLARHSTAPRGEGEPLVLGAGAVVCARAIVFAGARIGAGAILGDQSFVRERARIGDGSVIGRGSAVDNDVLVGARVRVQTDVYLTAYSVVEDDVFVGPGAMTTNDSTMSRHGADFSLEGALLRRACRIGGAAVLTPGTEIGEEAFVAAGAVVVRDVPAAGGRDGRAGPRGARGRRRGPARALAVGSARMSERPGGGLTPGDPLGGAARPERHGRALERRPQGYTTPGAARRRRPAPPFGAGPAGRPAGRVLSGWCGASAAQIIDGIIIGVGAADHARAARRARAQSVDTNGGAVAFIVAALFARARDHGRGVPLRAAADVAHQRPDVRAHGARHPRDPRRRRPDDVLASRCCARCSSSRCWSAS